MQLSPDAQHQSGAAVPAVAQEQSAFGPLVQQGDASKESRWSRWWDRLRAPKRIPLPLSGTETTDDASVELGAATDFDAF
jgi:hypothetical protein